ncbi:hypothetical protein N7452_000604 [Penicillium brevicompactum]|uniref:Protein kinase domain-containing protein n=1 Tax=Penicillium brevicompactum TaxID=5074 RepID=A0A9W9R2D5_PENBR|nr:hypothetical protein N7452_000604 [Penicillium brevicompactum]
MADQELVDDMKLDAQIDGDLTYHYTSEPDFTGRAGRQKRQIWRRDELLGRGGFGEVWLERCVPNQGPDKLRAVKIIPRPKGDNHRGLHLVELELRAIAKFSLLRVDPSTRPSAKYALTNAWLRSSIFDSGCKLEELTRLPPRVELNGASQESVPKVKCALSPKQDGPLASLSWGKLNDSLPTSYVQSTGPGRPSDGNRSKLQSSRIRGKEGEAPAEDQYAAFVPNPYRDNADEDSSRLLQSHQGKLYSNRSRSRIFHDHSQNHLFDQEKDGKAEDVRRQVSGDRRDLLSPNTNSHPRAQPGRSTEKHWRPDLSQDSDEEKSISDEGHILDHASAFSRYNKSEENPDPKERDPFTSHHHRGHKLFGQKQYSEAEKEYQKAYSGRRDTLGANHHDTLRSLSLLGDCLFKQHKDVQAEKACQDLLEGQKRRWIQSIKRHLGETPYRRSKYREAEKTFRGASEGYRDTVGEKYRKTLKALRCLGNAHFYQDNDHEAEKTYRRVSERYRDTLDRYGRVIVAVYRDFKGANEEIEERRVVVETAWAKTAEQLAFLSRVWEMLDEDHRALQGRIFWNFEKKFKDAVLRLSELDNLASKSGSLKAVKYALLKKRSLDRAIQDLQTSQKEFDMICYLVLLFADRFVDNALA